MASRLRTSTYRFELGKERTERGGRYLDGGAEHVGDDPRGGLVGAEAHGGDTGAGVEREMGGGHPPATHGLRPARARRGWGMRSRAEGTPESSKAVSFHQATK